MTRWLQRVSIPLKLTIIIMATCFAALFLAATAIVSYEVMTYRASMVQELTNLEEIVGANSTAALSFNNADDAREILNTLRMEPHIVSAVIFDRQGQSFAQYVKKDAQKLAVLPATSGGPGHRFAGGYVFLTTPMRLGDEVIGSIYLQADTAVLADRFRKYLGIMAVVLSVSVGLALWISFRLQRVVSRPIHDLAQAMRDVSANQDFSLRVVKSSEDELGQLMDGFNEMLVEIQGRDKALSEVHEALEVHIDDLRQEIIERKRIESNLARMAAILEATTDLVATVDLDGRLLYLNRAGRRMVGLPEDGPLPHGFLGELQPGWARRRLMEEGLPAAAREGVWSCETAFHRGPGGEVEVSQVVLAHRKAAGEVEFYSTIARDITERRQAERALAQERQSLAQKVEERTRELTMANMELAKAARLKDEFLASMSHELRTPLNAVLGLSEAMQEGILGRLNDKQRQSLKSIEDSGRHLLSLINDILDLSKIGAGKVDLELQPVQLELLCQASIALVRQAALKKRIDISYEGDDAVAPFMADQRRLKQVLVNLLGNAVKFTPEGGRVGLRVTGDSAGETVTLTVWDTGIGIAPEDQNRLFTPFVQLDSRLSRQYSGTGLGLALVRRMVELHGGTVRVESALGQGAAFHVTIPLGHSESLAPPPSEPAPPNASRNGAAGLSFRRALVVEDSTSAAEQVVRYLGEIGIEAITHARGQGVLALAHEVRPDLVILDVLLPDVSGWTLAHELRADPELRGVPLFIVSVVDNPEMVSQVRADGALVKPFTREQFRALVGYCQNSAPELAASTALAEPPAPAPSLEPAAPGKSAPDAPPAADNPVAVSLPGREDPAPLVLLVDDCELNRLTVSEYLLAYGYRVLEATDGYEAIRRAREDDPDIVLMDIQMPGLDGLQAIGLIRADASIRPIPIVALTGLAMTGDRERCLEAGANEYLSKPVRLRELIESVGRLLDAGRDAGGERRVS